jgi:hypothetical protein
MDTDAWPPLHEPFVLAYGVFMNCIFELLILIGFFEKIIQMYFTKDTPLWYYFIVPGGGIILLQIMSVVKSNH